MKYIKKFEIIGTGIHTHIPKYTKDDVVKIKEDKTNTFYVICGYDYRKDHFIKDICRIKRYSDKDKFATSEGFYKWIIEDQLEPVTDEELYLYLNTQKYNL